MAKGDVRSYAQIHLDKADDYLKQAQKTQGDKAVGLYRKARGNYMLAREFTGAALATEKILEIDSSTSREAAKIYREMASDAKSLGAKGSSFYIRKAEALERHAAAGKPSGKSLRKELEASGKT